MCGLAKDKKDIHRSVGQILLLSVRITVNGRDSNQPSDQVIEPRNVRLPFYLAMASESIILWDVNPDFEVARSDSTCFDGSFLASKISILHSFFIINNDLRTNDPKLFWD